MSDATEVMSRSAAEFAVRKVPDLLKPVVCLSLAMATAACAVGYVARYRIQGTSVARTPVSEDGSAPEMSEGEVKGRLPFARFEDDLASFEWEMTDTRLNLRVTNKSTRQDRDPRWLIVLLDCAEYVDPAGETHDLVPRDGTSSHLIAPEEIRVYSVFPADYMGTGRRFWWPTRALFEGPVPHRVVETPEGIGAEYKAHVGKTFWIRLPVRVGAVVYKYAFALTVSNVEPLHVRELF